MKNQIIICTYGEGLILPTLKELLQLIRKGEHSHLEGKNGEG